MRCLQNVTGETKRRRFWRAAFMSEERVWGRKLRDRDHSETCVDDRIILKRILKQDA